MKYVPSQAFVRIDDLSFSRQFLPHEPPPPALAAAASAMSPQRRKSKSKSRFG